MARMWRAVALLALVTTQACWLQVGAGPRRTGYTTLETGVTSANVADLAVAWTATAAPAPREALILGNGVYVRSAGLVTALRTVDGGPRWSAGSLPTAAAPAVVGDRLWVPTTDGTCRLAVLELATGAEVARHTFGPPDRSGLGGFTSCAPGDAAAIGGVVMAPWLYLGTSQSRGCIPQMAYEVGPGVTALATDGVSPGWSHSSTSVGCGTPSTPPEPAYGALSADDPDSAVVAVDRGVRQVGCTGAGCPEAWSATTGNTIVGPPVILPGADVAVAMDDGRVLVIDGTSQTVEWTGEAGGAIGQPLAADATTIVAVTDDGGVAAFPIGGCGAPSCPPMWTATLDAPASARPSIGADVVYVGGSDGHVTALPAAGCGTDVCDPLWWGSTPGAVTGAPAIAGGRVVVGSADGTVTAFALPDPAP